jgi:putative hydrolase of the HAD superfamily
MKTPWLEGIRAVTFDVGGTLIEPYPSVGHVYAATAAAEGFGPWDPRDLNRRFYSAWQRHVVTFDFAKASWARLVAEALSDLGPAAHSPELFEAIWRAFQQAAAWRIFPDVAPCLAAMKARGLRCAVISNWDERLVPTLRNLGLLAEFEFVLASAEVGWAKPAPEIFQRAQQTLRLPAHEILHVGDGRREDREGAAAVGMRGVWLDRSGSPAEGGVARLTDLLH